MTLRISKQDKFLMDTLLLEYRTSQLKQLRLNLERAL